MLLSAYHFEGKIASPAPPPHVNVTWGKARLFVLIFGHSRRLAPRFITARGMLLKIPGKPASKDNPI